MTIDIKSTEIFVAYLHRPTIIERLAFFKNSIFDAFFVYGQAVILFHHNKLL